MFLWIVVLLHIGVALIVAPSTQTVAIKLRTFAYGANFMFTSKDLPKRFSGSNYFRFKSPPSPGGKRVVRVVFIRHGQSVWNSLFNAFGLGWPVRVVKAAVLETLYFISQPFNSLIIDSPLSAKGVKEATELSQFIRANQSKLSLDTNTSVIVSSNLRRAMETAVIGLRPRISSTKERIVVDSSLQEGSRNIDAQTLSTEPGKIAPLYLHNCDSPPQLHTIFDPYLNAGNRTSTVDVYGRMDSFVRHVFGAVPEESLLPATGSAASNMDLKEVVVVGHSGYFLNFFRRFLPPTSTHIAKTKKMKNCSVVAFDLIRDDTSCEVYIDESSVAVMYRGF